jgi:hypothetical protein
MTIKENIDKIKLLSTDAKGDYAYIRLGGFGLIDGLAGNATKHDYYKIICIDDNGILLQGFRAHKCKRLPPWNFNQEYSLIFKKQFNKLPKLW